MKAILVSALVLGGCGGECLPSSLATAASITVAGAPRGDVVVARSAGEVGGAADPRVAAFVAATDFRTSDVALVRAGDDRQRLAGTKTSGSLVTVYYVGSCSPCGGGNPGSYYDAVAADQAARAGRTDLVRVPKGAQVAVHACAAECGTCPTNVP